MPALLEEEAPPIQLSSADLARKWTKTLNGVIDELEPLNRSTEKEFLRIGAKVGEFIDVVNSMSADLTALSDMISGEAGKAATEALMAALDLSKRMRERAADDNRLLAQMSAEAATLKLTLSHFSGTVATFHSLGLLTRIETARLGSAGADFGNLAEEVRLLARNVQTRVEGALETAADLIPRIDSALRDVSALQSGQAKQLPVVIAQALESLASFRAMQARSSDASVRLSSEYSQVGEAFTKVIMSMQFNDITRQQVEHVIDVLRKLGQVAADGKQYLEAPGADAILDVQNLQLANANGTFATSVDSLLESLDHISEHVTKMTEESEALSGVSSTGRDSFFGEMERGCSTILSSLRQCAAADASNIATNQGLAEKIALMQRSIEEIRVIELQMTRIAMNARISAVHLGSSGEALSALADSIKHRAFESRQGSDSLVETLASMHAIATASSDPSRTGSSHEEQDEVLQSLRAAVDELRSSQETSTRHISVVTGRGSRLQSDLAATCSSFKVKSHFGAVVGAAQNRIRAVVDEARSMERDDEGKTSLLELPEFSNLYTMTSERQIFAHAGDESVAQPITQTADDDIEFF